MLNAMAALPRKWVSDGAPTLPWIHGSALRANWEGSSSRMTHFSAAKRREDFDEVAMAAFLRALLWSFSRGGV